MAKPTPENTSKDWGTGSNAGRHERGQELHSPTDRPRTAEQAKRPIQTSRRN
jgi:hypothetical protein